MGPKRPEAGQLRDLDWSWSSQFSSPFLEQRAGQHLTVRFICSAPVVEQTSSSLLPELHKPSAVIMRIWVAAGCHLVWKSTLENEQVGLCAVDDRARDTAAWL